MLVIERKRQESITIGQRFGRLIVIGKTKARASKTRGMFLHWECKCDCGQIKLVVTGDLRRGFVRSCGCLRKEFAVTHGMSYSPEYRIWVAIRNRCGDPNFAEYSRYGGVGIKVCKRWESSFENFYEDMGSRPTKKHQIDRINGSLGYEPGNCRWVTPRENTNNRKNTVFLEYQGKRRPLSEWAEEFGLPNGVLYSRSVKRGWDVERALVTPRIPKPRKVKSC